MIEYFLQIFPLAKVHYAPLIHTCAFVSVADYIGFNFVAYTLRLPYRYWHMVQYPMLVCAGLFLGHTEGFLSGICFAILHWSFVNDWNFYKIGAVLNLKNGWENLSDLAHYLTAEKIEHSHWTIGYLLFKNDTPLFVMRQSFAAIVLVMFIKIVTDFLL